MTDPPVLYHVDAGVARLTLNRPHVLNALNTELAASLADAAARAAADPAVSIVIVRGAGRAFCSGIDRTALADGTVTEVFFRHWVRGLNTLEDMPKLTIAALHGHSIGGGLQIGLACDLRVATQDAVIGLGATAHGLIPDGAVLRLPRIVGLGRAKELALLNDEISADEARAIGLVNWVCAAADLEKTIDRLVAKARTASPTATAHTKRLLHASFHHDPRALIEDVMRAQTECLASWEITEANRAWLEKREARYDPPPARPRNSAEEAS